MTRAFAAISFTPNVQQIQTEMGSRHQYQAFEQGEVEPAILSTFEKQFIQERDSFYQATVGENGWPYVQHRGGPTGFIKVLNDQTIGYADFSGNRQYISVGNLSGDDRVSLILMNYPAQQRLKIWGRASVVNESTNPDIIAKLESPAFRAPIERGIIIHIEAFDWNCPKYITPRFTQTEIEDINTTPKTREVEQTALYKGKGSIPLTITSISQVAKDINSYTFKSATNSPLPPYEAGAHIKVPVQLADGTRTTRAYSLTSISKSHYQIAVKKEAEGQGASVAIHHHWQVNHQINIEPPENYFGLHRENLNMAHRPAVLIAGGIGITPIKAMAETLKLNHTPFELHYTGKSQKEMAFMDELQEQFQSESKYYFSRDANEKLNLAQVFSQAEQESLFYICGPNRLIESVRKHADQYNIPRNRLSFESFI